MEQGEPAMLPAVPGLRADRDGLVGIVISHAHPDHFGLLPQVRSAVPVYGPAHAQRMLRAASIFVGAEPTSDWLPLEDRQTQQLGPFELTPLLVDHSAYESYALLVEAGGRRLLYSGDLRAHGRKPGLWQRLLREPPKSVHALLLEGTRLSRAEQHNTTEQEVEEQLANLCRHTAGMVLAFYSGQNIDRLVTVYRACKRSRRTLVLDLYGAVVAAATQRPTIPQASWDGVEVFVPNAQRRRVIRSDSFEDINAVQAHRVFPEQLTGRASGMLLTMRGSMTSEIDRAGCLKDAAAVWSMWPGYLDRPSGQRVRDWLDKHQIPLTTLHASGHASVSDLRQLAEAIDPQRVVPIHTAVPERYSELFERAEPHGNGEWWSV